MSNTCEPHRNLSIDAPETLHNQLSHAMELAACVDACRENTEEIDPKIDSLLTGLSEELRTSIGQLRERMRVVAPSVAVAPPGHMSTQFVWTRPDDDDEDVSAQIESLFDGYTCVARETADAIAIFERLPDQQSVRILNYEAATVAKALWFLETYLTDLVFREDTSNLPDWPRAA